MKLFRYIAAGIAGVGLVVIGVMASDAAVKPDCATLSYPLCPRSVAATQVVDNSIPKSKIVPADRDAFLKDLNTPDIKGDVQVAKTFDPIAIANMGGSFKTRKTLVGSFLLPKGTWKLDASAFFIRTTAGVEGTHPMLALRVGASDTVFGDDFGTVFPGTISATLNREITGSTFKIVTVTEDTTVEVFGFGYNDDSSAAGGGEIALTASIAATRA